MEDSKFIELIKSIHLIRELKRLISLIEWLEKQYSIDKIGYNNFVMSALLQLYAISEILNCKTIKNEFNPFYIWAYYFDTYKHFDMSMSEGENFIKRFDNLFNREKDKLLKEKLLTHMKGSIKEDLINMINGNDYIQSKRDETFINKLNLEETHILSIIFGMNNSKNKDIDVIFFNLREKFFEPIFDSNLDISKKFWIEYIKPFLEFLILREKGKDFKKNNDQLWKEYTDKKQIKDDKFPYCGSLHLEFTKKE